VDSWLTEAAGKLGLSEADLRPDDETILLDQARIAAHESARTNAPLYCYLLGLAVGRSGRDLHELVG
jgi:uncharacterized protein DUF6457